MEDERRSNSARQNWRKVFAVRKFLSLAKFQSQQPPADLLVGQKYLVGKKIANGAFGQLRLARHTDTNAEFAIKLEPANAKIPMLFLEYRFYKTLGVTKGFPKVHYFGTCGKYIALVMDLLGPNLEELFVAQQKNFSLKTILQIAIQLLEKIEYVHSKNLIYRDIKPENCLVGRLSRGHGHIVNMVDFGLAKQYIDPETGRHINYCENKNLTGTVRYMSINAHQGKEQSRRDDLEALAYVFYYFLSKGNLPWQGVRCENTKKRYQIIGHIKAATKISQLNQDSPWEFAVYLRYCRNLKFTQTPDYTYLKFLFRGCMKRHHFEEDGVFDWSHYGTNVLTPKRLPAENDNESQSKKSPNQIGKVGKTNHNNNNDLQVPFIPILHQMSKSLPASLQGDEPTETDDETTKGPKDERESYRREKRFWKRGSKATSIMSTGNVVSMKNSPTSMAERKSRMTNIENQIDWQKIPKVEINQHVDEAVESGRESKNESGRSSKEENVKDEKESDKPIGPTPNGFTQTPKKTKSFRGGAACPSPKGKHLSVPKPVPGNRALNGAGSSKPEGAVKQPTIDSAEIDKSLLREKRGMFYKTSMSDKGVDIVDVDFPGCCPLIRVFKKSF